MQMETLPPQLRRETQEEWASRWLEQAKTRSIPHCSPPFWAMGGHPQTLLGHLLGNCRYDDRGEELVHVPLEDGGCLAVRHRPGAKVVVYLFHGLGGHASSDYVLRAAKAATDLGFAVFRANHRNCGEGAGLATGPYHSGRAEDLSAVIQWGRAAYPTAIHLAVGFSLSGNALLLLLSGRRGKTKPDLAISVNAPIDLASTSELISKGFNRLYDLRFGVRFKAYLRQNFGKQERKVEPGFWWKIRDYDAHYTAPFGGFHSPEHYYETCSTKNLLGEIQVPTFILTSADDPIVSVSHYLAANRSASVHLHVEEHGGHIGYFAPCQGHQSSFWLESFWSNHFSEMARL